MTPDFGPPARWFTHPLAWWRDRRCDRWFASWTFPRPVIQGSCVKVIP